MDKSFDITLLLDSFSSESRNLYESFVHAKVKCNAFVIEENGFLPDGIESIYGFFMGDFSKEKELPLKPLYFNQIKKPDLWRIEATNSNGKVMDKDKERARIFYAEPKHKRLVRIVDWLDDIGKVRISEHYNKYGAIFCRTIFNKEGQKVSRSFFSPKGQEVIVENLVTKALIVKWQGKDIVLSNKHEFLHFFIQCAGLENTSIFYNSLSYPFFASEGIIKNGYKDILFWNEEVGDSIPGNMQIILNGKANRTKKIYVQKKSAYDKLMALGASPDIVKQLGYIYSFARENQHRNEVLVCTNSEDVLHINELAEAVPNMHFHIAALTEMSSKLMSVGRHENISLYPNVKYSVLDSLFEKCDIYLDVNRGNEIVDAVHRAFLNRMLIVGFEETMHNACYTADSNVFLEKDYQDMAEALNIVIEMPELIDRALALQEDEALTATIEEYKSVIDGL